MVIKMSDIYSKGECLYYGIDYNKEVEVPLLNEQKPLYTIGTQEGDLFVPVLFTEREYAVEFIDVLAEIYPATKDTLVPLLSFKYYHK